MNPIQSIRSAWNRFIGFVHLRRGAHHYRRGNLARAASHIHAALRCSGPSFHAHLMLGRVYLRLNRFDRAREEFARARYLDPRRFMAHGLPEDLLLDMAERFQRNTRLSGHGDGGREPVTHGRSSSRHVQRDDFSSADERARFRLLPPIQPEELDDVDWEDLSRFLDE